MNRTEKLIIETSKMNRQFMFAGEIIIIGLILLSTGILMITNYWEFFGMTWFALGLLFLAMGLIYNGKAKETAQKIKYTYGDEKK